MRTTEELDVVRRFYERLEQAGYYNRRKAPVVTMPLSQQLAEAAKANPRSVVVHARAVDGTIIYHRPWTVMVEYVDVVEQGL